MNYPRELMRKTELQRECHLSPELLEKAYRTPGQDFAFKMDPTKKNSPILFMTDGLERWIQKRIQMEQRARKKNCVM